MAGLAPIVDLAATYAAGAGGNAVAELLGGSPSEQPLRFAAASPKNLLPLGIPQLILHGSTGDALPSEGARAYAQAAAAAGDPVQFVELPKAGHIWTTSIPVVTRTQPCARGLSASRADR